MSKRKLINQSVTRKTMMLTPKVKIVLISSRMKRMKSLQEKVRLNHRQSKERSLKRLTKMTSRQIKCLMTLKLLIYLKAVQLEKSMVRMKLRKSSKS